MRALTILLFICGAWVLGAAANAGRTAEAPYSARDLPRIVDPKPIVQGWSFEKGDPYIFPIPAHDPAFTLSELLGESPTGGQIATANKLRKAGFLIGRHEVWNSKNRRPRRPVSADAVVFAYLFRGASGARTGYRALRPDAPLIRGLGEEAVGLSDPEGALYMWRRRNLVIVAEINCDGNCSFPTARPTHTYAAEIDARAKQG
jgi:hypothetical protein